MVTSLPKKVKTHAEANILNFTHIDFFSHSNSLRGKTVENFVICNTTDRLNLFIVRFNKQNWPIYSKTNDNIISAALTSFDKMYKLLQCCSRYTAMMYAASASILFKLVRCKTYEESSQLKIFCESHE